VENVLFSFLLPRHHSQIKFISHEPLAHGFFNKSFNGAGGALSPWDGQLQNSDSSVNLMVDRLKSDYEGLTSKMRRPYGFKEVDSLVKSCLFNFIPSAFSKSYSMLFGCLSLTKVCLQQ